MRNSDYRVWTGIANVEGRTCKEKSAGEFSISVLVLFLVLHHFSHLYVFFFYLSCLSVVILINYSAILTV